METGDVEGITLTENEQSSAGEEEPAREEGFALQFSLNEEQPSLEKEISLSVPAKITAPFTFEIREKDITVAAEEPAGAEPKVELAAAPLQFTADFQWELALQTEENDENAAFSMQAVSLNEKEPGTVYTESAEMALIFTLPEGTAFPEEEAVYDAEKAAIKMGDAEVLYFNGLPEGVSVTGVSAESDGSLKVMLVESRAQDDLAAELTGLACAVREMRQKKR